MWRKSIDGMETVEKYECLKDSIVDHNCNMTGEGE